MIIHIKGAGIAGCALYRAAQDLGHTPVLHDRLNRTASSKFALAVLHSEGWQEAAKQYEEWGVPVLRGARVTGYRRKDPTPTIEQRWVAVDPVASLDLPFTTSEAPEDAIDATANVEWGEVTYGVTLMNPNPESLRAGFHLHHYAPYKTATAIQWSHGARIGSSSSKNPQKAVDQMEDMWSIALEQGWIVDDQGWEWALGTRVKAQPAPGRFGGFHRDGWTLSALTAHDYIKNHTS